MCKVPYGTASNRETSAYNALRFKHAVKKYNVNSMGLAEALTKSTQYVNRGYMLVILLPAGTSIVLPVGYMNQPTGLLHIYL